LLDSSGLIRLTLETGMKWDALEEEPCSLARTIGVIGDRWTLLILRECFLRTRRFEGFQSALRITRHLLAERLKKLVRQGVLRRIPYQESPKRHEYILTQKGLDLYPIMMALVHWGDTHMVDERGRPLLHEHRKCGKNFDPVMVCSECGEPLSAKEVHTHPGPVPWQSGAQRTGRQKCAAKSLEWPVGGNTKSASSVDAAPGISAGAGGHETRGNC
jgi:DNA-binding HxlR family transcriptional regulator